MTVPDRVTLITLGVADVAAATGFYEGLGWQRSGASTPDVTFFRTGGTVVALWGAEELAADAGLPGAGLDRPAEHGRRRVVLAINVASPAEVTDWGGYNGYFADPDGHLWEVAHNPFWPLRDDGSVELPD